MYLENVLADIKKETVPPKLLTAEHLYKLNEAIFNLPEEDRIDQKQVTKLFVAVEKVRQAYNEGKIDNSDSNFFYDYVALLGTMQNQHFFSFKQTDKMLEWIKEAVDESAAGAGPTKAEQKAAATIKKLEDEVARLRVASERRQQQDHLAASPSKGKGKKGKGAPREDSYDSSEASSARKGGGKTGKKGKAGGGHEPESKPKKSKAKGKGKGKADRSESPYEERPAKGSGKGKGGKGKGKGQDSYDFEDERPPVRGKGGGDKGGGRGSSKGKGKGKSGGKGW